MCKNSPTVMVNIVRQLSNYAGKASVFGKNSRYSPQFFKGGLVRGFASAVRQNGMIAEHHLRTLSVNTHSGLAATV